MSDNNPTPQPQQVFPKAKTVHRHFASIWLIPIVAAVIAGYLGWHDYAEHGPLITVTFKTAQGLVAGQTQVKYKDVTLGTVENVRLNQDLSGVVASIRMTQAAEPFLTEQARLWVVRPQFNTFNAADFETLVSGSYIQIEPGAANAKEERHFAGLESPPADRADEPGRTFVLHAPRLDSLTIGSSVYYRDINVGQVLGYDSGNGFGPITLTVFIRDPYSQYVRDQSRFWNASGVSITMGATGLHLETHSLRSILGGGIAFYTPSEVQSGPAASPDTVFDLYDNEAAAETAAFSRSISYATYFQASVKDLGRGSPVLLYGIQVGEVTSVKLTVPAGGGEPRARVDFDIQPDRAFGASMPGQSVDGAAIMSQLIGQGMRAKLESASLITGQKELALEFSPNATPVDVATENGVPILPSSGSADDLMGALGDVANKLNSIPFEDIGKNLDHLVKSADQSLGGTEMKQAVHNLSVVMENAADLSRKANTGMTPALQRLPDISQQLQEASTHANQLLSSYGAGSDFQRDAKRALDQVNDAARSIRLLADYLERHPEALLNGKAPDEKDKQ